MRERLKCTLGVAIVALAAIGFTVFGIAPGAWIVTALLLLIVVIVAVVWGRPTAPWYADRGTGLSLAIAKGIVETHGGRIWAEQRAGGGTVIKMMLPMSDR